MALLVDRMVLGVAPLGRAMDSLQDSSAPSVPPPAQPLADAEFALLLLLALSTMASRSKRGQADVAAALRGAQLEAEPRRIRTALRRLQAEGAISNLVPLSDGGLLVTVATGAVERQAVPIWLPDEAEDGTEH